MSFTEENTKGIQYMYRGIKVLRFWKLVISYSSLTVKMCKFRHSHGPGLGENISVDVHHQVSSRCVLHDKTNVLLRLETRKQVDQERVADAVDCFENPLLTHQTGKERKRRRHCELQSFLFVHINIWLLLYYTTIPKVSFHFQLQPWSIFVGSHQSEQKLQMFTCPLHREPQCLLSSALW